MTPARHNAELVLPLRADLAEGPMWDPRPARLHFVDVTTGRIHRLDPATAALHSIDTGLMAGCVVPRANGQLVAALTTGLWALEADSGAKTFLIGPPEHDARRCRFNDGKCDPQGRLWAGTMGLKAEAGAGALYCFPDAGKSHRAVSGVTVSNGLAWSADGTTMYYIDSPTRRVDAFDFDGRTGQIANRRTAFALPDGRDVPDGCTIDSEDMLWVAHWGGGKVTRWEPRTGRHLATIDVPAPHTSSCTFGGPNLETLYITTARRGLDATALAAFPDSGGIFACRPGVRGLPAEVFRG